MYDSPGTKIVTPSAAEAALPRIAAALELLAASAARIAQATPAMQDDDQRWAWHVAPTAVAMKADQPETVKDPKTRRAILARSFGERLAVQTLPFEQRAEVIAKRKAEYEARQEHNAGASSSSGSEGL